MCGDVSAWCAPFDADAGGCAPPAASHEPDYCCGTTACCDQGSYGTFNACTLCPKPERCIAARDGGGCAEGYAGADCSECDAGADPAWIQRLGDCVQCPAGSARHLTGAP